MHVSVYNCARAFIWIMRVGEKKKKKKRGVLEEAAAHQQQLFSAPRSAGAPSIFSISVRGARRSELASSSLPSEPACFWCFLGIPPPRPRRCRPRCLCRRRRFALDSLPMQPQRERVYKRGTHAYPLYHYIVIVRRTWVRRNTTYSLFVPTVQ